MRIGNLDDMNQSNQSDNLIELLQSDYRENLTKTEKLKNWWHYRKWYVIIGAFLFAALISIVGSMLGLFTKSSDLQIAYVGTAALPQDTITAIQDAFTALADDYNGDGEIIVQVNQYVLDGQTVNAENAYSQYASEVTLIADISECESYLFLLDHPQEFQQEYQVLAMPDGTCPDEADYSVEDKIILWAECPPLAGAELGTFTENIAGQNFSGSNQDILSGLFLARRCFYGEKMCENTEECGRLWELLYDSRTAAQQCE